MALHLTLTYGSGADLRVYLLDQVQHGAVLLPVEGDLSTLTQFDEALLDIAVGEAHARLRAQVLQVLPGTGIVLQLADPGDLALLADSAMTGAGDTSNAGGSAPQEPHRPPTVELAALSAIRALEAIPEADVPWEDDGPLASHPPADHPPSPEASPSGETCSDDLVPPEDALPPETDPTEEGKAGTTRGAFVPAGSSPVSWSIELLVSRWDGLTLAERIRVARYGNRPARGLVLRGTDRGLHIHLLQNPGLTLEEVALMAGMANLDQVTLQRIATSVDWQKQSSVARALLTNPKLPQTFVPRLVKNVPRDELSRLTRTGKVRASVKEIIVKYLDRTR